jgi:hypothetical protein
MAMLQLMPWCTAIIIRFEMLIKGINSIPVGIHDATTASELLVHYILVSDCVVLVTVDMFVRA